jgi:hypothetical protein
MENKVEAVVSRIPKCDFCDKPALYDGKTNRGPWGYMCEEDFKANGLGLGLGRGQKLVQAPKEVKVKKTYKEWLQEVDNEVVALCGMGMSELPDYLYSESYNKGKSSKATAKAVIKNANDTY